MHIQPAGARSEGKRKRKIKKYLGKSVVTHTYTPRRLYVYPIFLPMQMFVREAWLHMSPLPPHALPLGPCSPRPYRIGKARSRGVVLVGPMKSSWCDTNVTNRKGWRETDRDAKFP